MSEVLTLERFVAEAANGTRRLGSSLWVLRYWQRIQRSRHGTHSMQARTSRKLHHAETCKSGLRTRSAYRLRQCPR